jgi:hypothetical protein
MTSIPDADERNHAVWDAWDLARGEITKQRYAAQDRFDGWRHIPDVCHFAEHVTATKSGPIRVAEPEIRAICKNLNRRCRLGLLPPLISKHTIPNPAAPEEAKPYIVGYGATYRIGMIDDGENVRYAIFGDEFHDPKHLKELNGKPRRSVELIVHKDSTRNYFDPIACLGPDSPRIEIPPAYYSVENEDGAEVVRYSISVPVVAGASNTYVKSFGDQKERYQSEPPVAAKPTETPKVLQPDDLNQIVDAVKNILAPYLPALDQLVAGGQANQAPGQGMQDQGQPVQMGQGGQVGQPSPMQDALSLGQPGASSPGSQQKPNPMQYQNCQPMRYSAENELEETDPQEVERYAAIEANYNTLLAEHSKLKREFGKLMTERTDAIRSHRLTQLAAKYPAIDLERETSKVLYSAGSEMTDEEFDDHIETVEYYAAQASPLDTFMPEGEAEDDSGELPVATERYSARVQNEVVRRCTEAVSKGEYADYEAIEKVVCEEFNIK